MSIDRSLKTAASLARHRNVLSRAERVAKLTEKGGFKMDASDPLHLPKVAHRKVAAGGKTSKKADAAEGAAATPAAGGAKAAAPAGKAAAPAAKAAPKK